MKDASISDNPSVWAPLPECYRSIAPNHVRYSWTAIASITNCLFSVVEATDTVGKEDRFVPRLGYLNTLIAIFTTTLAGLSGYLGDEGCVSYKVTNIFKIIILVAVNRLSFEKIDVLSIFIALAAPIYILVVAGVSSGWWSLLDPSPFTLMLNALLYLWLTAATMQKARISAGTIGSAVPLVMAKCVMLATSGYEFAESPPGESSRVQMVFQVLPSFLMIPEGLFQYLTWKFGPGATLRFSPV
jgi:hypothetical protein